jgi:putative ABC transport system permease protein
MTCRDGADTVSNVSFGALVFRNLFRQRVRTALTVLGIAIGITTVVALGAIMEGVRVTSGDFVNAGGADFMVAQDGASDLTFSAVPAKDVERIAALDGVERANGALIEVSKQGDNPYFLVFGYEPESLPGEPLELVTGRLPDPAAEAEALIGTGAAAELDLGVGGTIEIDRRPFEVVGVYDVDDRLRGSGAIVPLATLQQLSRRQDVVTAIHVSVAPGADPEAVADAVERDLSGLAAIRDVDEYSKVDQGFEIIDSANLAISLLAVGIGAIGVMNTMIMSVYERTREIGILRAVGWRGSRILRLVVYESLFLCFIAAGVGVALGILASRAVLLVPSVSTFLVPSYPLEVFVRALAVGVLVALMGAVYPAVRAVRLSPMEALRHE